MRSTFLPTEPTTIPTTAVDPAVEPTLPLWLDQDPNLHTIGVYIFLLQSQELRQSVEAIATAEKPASTLEVELTKATLRIRSQRKDGDFEAISMIPLARPANIGERPVHFELSRPVMMAWANLNKQGLLRCVYDANEQSLFWQVHDADTAGPLSHSVDKTRAVFRLHAKACLPFQREEGGLSLGRLFPETLAKGLTFASIFLDKQKKQLTPLDGVGVSDGSVRGGCLTAISRFSSDELPTTLKFVLPKAMSLSVRTLLRRISGEAEIIDFGERHCARGRDLEISWKKGGYWPIQDDGKIFDRPHLAACVVDTTRLALDVATAEIVSDVLRIKLATRNGENFLHISAAGRVGTVEAWLGARMIGPSPEAEEPWDVVFNAKDVAKAAEEMRMQSTEVRLLDRAVVFVATRDKSISSVIVNGIDSR